MRIQIKRFLFNIRYCVAIFLHYAYLMIAQSTNAFKKLDQATIAFISHLFQCRLENHRACLNTLVSLCHHRCANFSRISKPFMLFHEMVSYMRHHAAFSGNVWNSVWRRLTYYYNTSCLIKISLEHKCLLELELPSWCNFSMFFICFYW